MDDRFEDDAVLSSHATDDYRRLARETTLQFLYQWSVQGEDCLEHLESFLESYCPSSPARALVRHWLSGCRAHHGRIEELIGKASRHWDLSRISLVDRCNLWLACYHLLQCPEIPYKVVINESVELAKLYSTAQAGGFINGVLEGIRHALKTTETAGDGD